MFGLKRKIVVAHAAGLLAMMSGIPVAEAQTPGAVIDQYCTTCHSQAARTAGVELETPDPNNVSANAGLWERVVAKLRAGSMPPSGSPRPEREVYDQIAEVLERELDRAWESSPNPGRIAAVHRLNRVEYNNAVRDLLALEIDVKPLLPGDETADGSFDNFADSLSISTSHLERYMSVARQVTRLATGLPPSIPAIEAFEIPLHVLQEDRQSEDLPLGSRGGMAIPHNFPVDGEYVITVRLQRQYQDYLKGMGWPQQLDVRLDGRLLERFTVGGAARGRPAAASFAGAGEVDFAGDPAWEEYMQLTGDAGLEVRVRVDAGPHVVGVSFVRELWEPEGLPQPLQRGRVIGNDQVYMDYANVGAVEIGGPYVAFAPVEDTPSRGKIFVCDPAGADQEAACAETILSRIARLAYRRPVNDRDLDTLMAFFEEGRASRGSFDSGIQFALERLLVDPDFLLRIYRDAEPNDQGAYTLSDLELASRLSFFLWSSIPDDRLLSLAEQGQLNRPDVLEGEVRRMLADPRAVETLVDDFASQWLNLRRVEEVVVDPEVYPHYDLSLMQGFQTETELFVASTIEEDRSVHDLIDADYTFVNERVARQYGIPGVYGSRFRRVTLPDHDQRGGLLSQGALLATTSYPDRTSPVLRGKWLLDNILAQPVPPPPADVPALEETAPGTVPTSIRERLSQHRSNPVCNSCHAVIDPLGFSLENFDVIGGWRTIDEAGQTVDASGTTAGGARINGLTGLRSVLLDDPEAFPRTVTEKLYAYALGRRLEYYDQPAVRKIVDEAAGGGYRWSSLILGIVRSPAFLMRSTASLADAE
jgi:hypothetical protein